MTQNTAAGEWKTGSQIQLKQNGKRWSRKAVKTIWQIGYAPQCGTELLIWELGLLNLSFHYSNRNPKDICSLQFSDQWARSVVLTVKSRFIFHFKTRKCRTVQPVFSWKLCSATPWTLGKFSILELQQSWGFRSTSSSSSSSQWHPDWSHHTRDTASQFLSIYNS